MADRDDNPGVLGNLPRSRPGQRSTKRSSGTAARKARAASSARGSASAKRTSTKSSTRTSAKRPTTAARPAPPPRPRRAPPTRDQSSDPLGQAVELAGKVATIGLRTAAGVIKRLPRP